MSYPTQPPFDPNASNQVPNPYRDTGFYGPPPKPSAGMPWWLIILLIVIFAGGGGAMVVCCGGVVWLGANVEAESASKSVRGNKVIEERIGNVRNFSSDIAKTLAAADEETVFRIEGTKGSGYIYAELDEDDAIIGGELRMDSGERFDLFPDK